jgi:hypothetical protein
MLLLASALAATPSALSTYRDEVAVATERARAIVPKLARCPLPEASRMLAQVELGTGEVTVVAVSVAGNVKVASPCVAEELAHVYTRHKPKVGREADLVFSLADGLALEGDVALLGDLTNEQIEAGMRSRIDRIATCYVSALPEFPGVHGELVVNVTVLPDGKVGRADVQRTALYAPPVEQCVLSEVAQVTFAAPSDGAIAHVTYPFRFDPPR